MKKISTIVLALLLMAFASNTSLLAKSPNNTNPPAQAKPAGKEDHPHIQNAMKALENAKHQLETAAHDFDGHRSKALEHVNQALEECREALRADKK